MTSNLVLAFTISVLILIAYQSLKIIPLSVFAIILNLKPIMVIILGVMFGIETFTPRKLMYVCISFFGSGLIINPMFFRNLIQFITHRTSVAPGKVPGSNPNESIYSKSISFDPNWKP